MSAVTTTQTYRRKIDMHILEESLVKAQVRERLEEARQRRLAHQLLTARRLSRKAEKAAAQAKLALARVI